MKYYQNIKNSGIDWLGPIPAHWEIIKNKWEFRISKESISHDDLKGIIVTHYSIPSVRDTGSGYVQFGDDIDSDKFVITGNEILISKLNPRKTTVIISRPDDNRMVCSTEFMPLIAKKCSLKYAFYLFSSYFTRERLSSSVHSVTASHERTSPEFLLSLWNAFPPKLEQQWIEDFLDRETIKINRIITLKQELIKLLQEKRQSLINRVVTKGIDTYAPMKDSGVKWIGEIPEHWTTGRIKNYTTKIGSGITPKGGSEVYVEKGIPLIRSQNVHFNRLNLDDVVYISSQMHDTMKDTKLHEADVLMNITGASLGRCAVVPRNFGEGNVNQHVCIIRPENGLHPQFLNFYLASPLIQGFIYAIQVGASRQGLTFDDIGSLSILLPPLDEQLKIGKLLNDAIFRSNLVIKKTRQQIGKLQEYREALIQAAVTGEIDVRQEITVQ